MGAKSWRAFKSSATSVAFRSGVAMWRGLHGISDATAPPEVAVMDLLGGMLKTHVVATVTQLGIPDKIADGGKTAQELASELGLNAGALHRVMRAAAAFGVFELRPDGVFRNNRLSEVLRSTYKGSVRHFALISGMPAFAHAFADLQRTIVDGASPFERIHGKSVWQYFDEHPSEGAIFAEGMARDTELEGLAIAEGYPFETLKRVCDVGGGRGPLIAALLSRYPELQGVLFDSERVTAQADEMLDAYGVRNRVVKVHGSFFGPVPTDCDGYLLKDVLDDWDDERCIQILRNVRGAMSKDAKLFVIDIIADRNDPDYLAVMMDIQMMVVTDGGRQRSIAEMETLFGETGLRLESVHSIPSPRQIVVAVPV